MGLISIPFLNKAQRLHPKGASTPLAGTACSTPFREKLWKTASTKLCKIMLIIQITLLFCSLITLLLQVKSESALGVYWSKNHFCNFWPAKVDIPGLGVQCTFCSQGGLPRALNGSSVAAVLWYEQIQPPVSDLQRSLANLCKEMIIATFQMLWILFQALWWICRVTSGMAFHALCPSCSHQNHDPYI